MTKQFITKITLTSVLISLLHLASHAQINLNQPLAADTSVTVGHLSNGLTYYIRPNAKPLDKVELRLVLKAGSIQEDDNQQGLAHFMEHMEFNGLKHYPKNELVDYLQKIGVRFGADLNANTAWDRTYYMLPVPTDNPSNLEKGVQILADWAGGALISDDEVNAERRVILEELRMREKNAQTRMMLQYFPSLLNNSRYAYRIPGGKDSIVQNADPERIRTFYKDWYRPDLMAIILVGSVTVPQAEALIKKYFGNLKNPVHARERTYYQVSPYTTKKAMIVTDSENTGYGISLLYPSEHRKQNKTLADLREGLIKSVFLQCLNRRYRDIAQKPDAPFTSAKFSLDGGLSGLTLLNQNKELDIVPVDLGHIPSSIQAAANALISVAQYGFNDEEVAISEKGFLPSLENAYKERNDIPSASFTDELADAFMKNDPIIGIGNEYQYVKDLLPSISTADINAYAKKAAAVPKNYFELLTAPAKDKSALPNASKLINITEAAFQQVGVPIQKQNANTSLLDKDPIGGKIVKETKDDQLDAITYTLSNGLKVTIKKTEFQKDQILFSGTKYGGSNLYGAEDKVNTTFFGSVISTMGFGKFTPSALNDFLSGKQVDIKTGMSGIADEVSGASSVKDAETMLQLMYLELTEPRKDTALLRGWLNKVYARLPLLNEDPQNVYKDTLTKVLYGNTPLTPIVIPSKEDLNKINADRIIEMYKERFSYADGFHFFFVGNVNADSLKPLIEKYIGGLKVKGIKPVYKDNGLRMVKGDKLFKFYKGVDKKSMLSEIWHGDIEYSSDLALKADMLAQIMSMEVLKKIREEKQWIYSGGVSASVTKLPYGYYSIEADMPCGPENVDSIFNELDKEAAVYKKNGVAEEDLQKVQKAMIEHYKESIKQNAVWLGELKQTEFWKSDKNDFLNFEARVNSVTAEDLKKTANQLLKNNNFKTATFPDR